MCIQPPDRSVATLQPGQGLLVVRMVTVLGSAATQLLLAVVVALGRSGQGRQGPRCAPAPQSRQNTYPHSGQPTLLQCPASSSPPSSRIPAPHPGCGQSSPPSPSTCRPGSYVV